MRGTTPWQSILGLLLCFSTCRQLLPSFQILKSRVLPTLMCYGLRPFVVMDVFSFITITHCNSFFTLHSLALIYSSEKHVRYSIFFIFIWIPTISVLFRCPCTAHHLFSDPHSAFLHLPLMDLLGLIYSARFLCIICWSWALLVIRFFSFLLSIYPGADFVCCWH